MKATTVGWLVLAAYAAPSVLLVAFIAVTEVRLAVRRRREFPRPFVVGIDVASVRVGVR